MLNFSRVKNSVKSALITYNVKQNDLLRSPFWIDYRHQFRIQSDIVKKDKLFLSCKINIISIKCHDNRNVMCRDVTMRRHLRYKCDIGDNHDSFPKQDGDTFDNGISV